ncbi:tetratricopeptide repeat protein [Cupriavidus sp. 30B13]|uniref:tetratricopeptide repeat protein n=1 Tax=Cupriavidus sp. 30B13 TaxID=3384241 RepID=UPI003B905B52
MSLFLPTLKTASPKPARRRAAAASIGLAAMLAGLLAAAPAGAQHGPLSLPAPVTPPGGVRSADPGMAAAEKAAAQKQYDEAISGFDRVLATNPRNAQARFERAWALAQAGREDDAIAALTSMAQDFPELPEPHNNLALLYAKRGDLKRAEAELLVAVDVKPDFSVGYANLGDVYRRLAENAYRDALRRNPKDAVALAGLRQLAPAPATPAPAPAAAGARRKPAAGAATAATAAEEARARGAASEAAAEPAR